MRKAFVLTECLIAAALAAIVLPLLAQRFSENLLAVQEMRRIQEAQSFAESSLERSHALRESGATGEFEERLTGNLGVYDAAVSVESTRATVEVKWDSSRGERVFRLSRGLE